MELLESVVFWSVALAASVILVVTAYFAGSVVLP